MKLTYEEVRNILPHRYPFIMVDKIVELEAGNKAVGIKNVSGNEPFFQGHFPSEAVMPGVLQVEAVGQVGAVAVLIPASAIACTIACAANFPSSQGAVM